MGGSSFELSRRRFIQFGLATSISTLIGSQGSIPITLGETDPKTDKIVVAENGTPTELVSGAFQALGGIAGFVSQGDKVLIKPNASFAYAPERATTTSPDVAAAVIDLCYEAGASEVILADHLLMSPASVTLERNGLREAAERHGAEFEVLGKRSDFELVEIEGSRVLGETEIAKTCLNSDVLINLPVLKHHSSTDSTIGIKNLMGLVYDRGAFHRKGLEECIAELSLVIKPDLTIVDATRALLSNGPRGPGDVVEIGKMVAGVDPVSVDLSSLALGFSLGYPDFELNGVRNRYISYAANLGVGDGDPVSVASKTLTINAAGSQDHGVTVADEEKLDGSKGMFPGWAPYATLSAVTVALGTLATLYSRRRAKVAGK
jgi:uncharacterized protein (DUF362 family)